MGYENLVNDILNMQDVEQKIIDNKIIFTFQNDSFKVKKLNVLEKEELKKYMSYKMLELAEDKQVKKESDWIAIWKEKGIDIEGIDEEVKTLLTLFNKALYELGRLISISATPKELDIKEKECKDLKSKIANLNAQKIDLLSASYESQLVDYMYKYMVFLSLEKLEGEVFKKVFNSYEDMLQNISPELMCEAVKYVAMVENYAVFK